MRAKHIHSLFRCQCMHNVANLDPESRRRKADPRKRGDSVAHARTLMNSSTAIEGDPVVARFCVFF